MTTSQSSSDAENSKAFAVRGSAINDRFSWQIPFELDAVDCQAGQCQVPEKLRARLVVDPGTGTSRFQVQVTALGTDVFNRIHFQAWVLCFRNQQVCGGPEDSPGFSSGGSRTWFLSSSGLLKGDKITHAFIFWAHVIPRDNYYASDKAKSGSATCYKRTGDNRCLY
jgi:hypothetical protein